MWKYIFYLMTAFQVTEFSLPEQGVLVYCVEGLKAVH